ncbi:hypothetical protein J2798_004399 [Herbaspirillum seropedicae]|nr:hypothetical protein [Herbaspirillum seropedicae]
MTLGAGRLTKITSCLVSSVRKASLQYSATHMI